MVNPNSAVPVYLQIRDKIKEQIRGDVFKAGDKLPSERELCQAYQVSRIPVRKALEMLEQEGLIQSVHGKGTFVREAVIDDSLSRISSFSETLAQRGYTGYTKIVSYGPNAQEHSYDMILDSTACGTASLKLLGYANDHPVVFYDSAIKRPLSDRFLEAAKACEEAAQAFSTFDLYSRVGVSIGKVNQRVLAVNAPKEIAQMLDIAEGAALLMLETVIFDGAMQPVEYKRGYYRTDKYSFTLHRIL